MNEILLNTINGHYDDGSCCKDNIPGGGGGGGGLDSNIKGSGCSLLN